MEIVAGTSNIHYPFILVMMPISIEATPKMVARAKPNLLYLLAAVFAGFVGTLAIIDERVGPTLPGVAIVTVIVPPFSKQGCALSSVFIEEQIIDSQLSASSRL